MVKFASAWRDLNKACQKDDFPFRDLGDYWPHIILWGVLVPGWPGYNQIKMDAEDQKHTAFRTPRGIYCYKVMPFGRAHSKWRCYRAMTKIFDDHLIHKIVECYVDDLVVKATSKEEHLEFLRIVFMRLRKYNLKMNPASYYFFRQSSPRLKTLYCTTRQ